MDYNLFYINNNNENLYHNYIKNGIIILTLGSTKYYERFINNQFYCITIKKKINL